MNALPHALLAGWWRAILFCLALQALSLSGRVSAINIVIDYRYDTPNPTSFFDTQQKKDALQAAADRYSRIITETLSGVTLTGVPANTDHRIGFTHPTTGVSNFQVSAATSAANDSLAPPNCTASSTCFAANEYRGAWSIPANQLIIYPGGRSLPGSTAGEANTGTGLNFTTVFNSPTSHLNRNFRSSGGVGYLPMWGGAIAFDDDASTTWHFDHTTAAPAGTTDFYSIALHEIGHILGLSTDWNEWGSLSSGGQFHGPNTWTTYNGDNGTSLTSLGRTGDGHFQDGAYDSYIFQNESPNPVGTVGTGAKQDLLMEPIANFTGAIRRFELTNVDVAALRDVGWSTVAQINLQPGDYNKNGVVDAADFVVWRKGQADNNYATWRANFGEGSPGAASSNSPAYAGVPEPASWLILASAISAILASMRPPRSW